MAKNVRFDWFRHYEGLIAQSGGREVPEEFSPEREGFELVCELTDIEEQKDSSYEGYEPEWWHAIYVFQKGHIFIAREWHETRYSASFDNEYEGGAIWIDMEA